MQDIARKLLEPFQGAVTVDRAGKVEVPKRIGLVSRATTQLAWNAVFGDTDQKDAARWLLWQIGQVGRRAARPRSTSSTWRAAAARCRASPCRRSTSAALAYDTARALFRAAQQPRRAARSSARSRAPRSATPTSARPSTRSWCWRRRCARAGAARCSSRATTSRSTPRSTPPIPRASSGRCGDLTAEAIAAGFYNIDVDTSTLVDLSQPTATRRSSASTASVCAEITAFIRAREPEGVTVSVGGEIGEVGGKNSTPEELHAFMDGLPAALGQRAPGARRHQQDLDPDRHQPRRRAAARRLDRPGQDRLRRRCERCSRDRARAVRHGRRGAARRLHAAGRAVRPLPRARDGCEIHLATEFQNMLFDHPAFPAALKREIYELAARPTRPTSARPATPTSSSSTRRARRRSARSSASCGALPAEVGAHGARRRARGAVPRSCSRRCASTARPRWSPGHVQAPVHRRAEPPAATAAAPDDAEAGE